MKNAGIDWASRFFKILGIALLLMIGIPGCVYPSGVIEEEEILIMDTEQRVNTEDDAANLAMTNLATISEAELARIPGEINEATLLQINAWKIERNGASAFLVSMEYVNPDSMAEGDNGKVVITVTGDGKIYGYAIKE